MTPEADVTSFADSLRSWRKARHFSQLALAVEAEVSARHISFLETGRARPSRGMIDRLGEALQLPLAARNHLLGRAGFAPRYPGRRWDADDMASIRAALEHTLTGHCPYPAMAIDRLWTVFRMNSPAATLFAPLGIVEGCRLLDLLLSERLQGAIENWAEVARHMAQRLRTESVAQGGVGELERAASVLARVPGSAQTRPLGPVVPAIYRNGDMRLSLFSTIAQFGTPEDLTLDDLRIELFFPADADSEGLLRGVSA